MKPFPYSRVQQTTIADEVSFTGTGVHSGLDVSIRLLPAAPDSGIRFLAKNIGDQPEVMISALWSNVRSTELCTVLASENGTQIATVEHLLSALAGLGIDNVIIEIDGPETPVMDGSAVVFVEAIDAIGVVDQAARRNYLKILRPVHVSRNGSEGHLYPYDGFEMDVTIDFPDEVIGCQAFHSEMSPEVFRNELAGARTFGYLSDVEKLWKLGFALGSSLENSVAISEGRVLNSDGLRWADEFVRHKALDAVGDLALAGMPILGCFVSYKGGHSLNYQLLQSVFSDSDNYEICNAPVVRFARPNVSQTAINDLAMMPEAH